MENVFIENLAVLGEDCPCNWGHNKQKQLTKGTCVCVTDRWMLRCSFQLFRAYWKDMRTLTCTLKALLHYYIGFAKLLLHTFVQTFQNFFDKKMLNNGFCLIL